MRRGEQRDQLSSVRSKDRLHELISMVGCEASAPEQRLKACNQRVGPLERRLRAPISEISNGTGLVALGVNFVNSGGSYF